MPIESGLVAANAARGIVWGINRKSAGAFAAAGWGEARGRGKNPMGGRLGAANRGGGVGSGRRRKVS
jgi:hypothetical protein